jgi:hypothetical protein
MFKECTKTYHETKSYQSRLSESYHAPKKDNWVCQIRELIIIFVFKVPFWGDVHKNLMCRMRGIANFGTCKHWINHACYLN